MDEEYQIANQSSLEFFRNAQAPSGGIEGIASPRYQMDCPAFIAFAETHHDLTSRSESYLLPYKLLTPSPVKGKWIEEELPLPPSLRALAAATTGAGAGGPGDSSV